MQDLPADMRLRDVVDPALINIGVLVNDGDRVIYRVVVQLRLVIAAPQVELELGRFLDRAGQLVGQAVAAPLEGVERGVKLLDWQAEGMRDGLPGGPGNRGAVQSHEVLVN